MKLFKVTFYFSLIILYTNSSFGQSIEKKCFQAIVNGPNTPEKANQLELLIASNVGNETLRMDPKTGLFLCIYESDGTITGHVITTQIESLGHIVLCTKEEPLNGVQITQLKREQCSSFNNSLESYENE